jgi:hypothetical protein
VIGWLESAIAPKVFRRGKGLALTAVSVAALHIIYMMLAVQWAEKNQLVFLPDDHQPIAGSVMEEDGFDFEVPGGEWREYDISKTGQDVRLGFARMSPGVDFSAWVTNDSSGYSPQSAADEIVARLQQKMTYLQMVDDRSNDIRGLHGIRVCCRGAESVSKPEEYMVIWVSMWTGHRIALITVGSVNDLDAINDAADDMLSHFHPQGGAFAPHWHGTSAAQKNSQGLNSQANAL